MTFSIKIRHLLVTAAIVLASVIQLVRGYRPVVVMVSAAGFLLMGNAVVFVADSKDRALRQQRKRDYYAGKI